MGTFKLPDLGEGLAEAEILEWHVKPGEQVLVDQPMVSVETAKAVVEVPVPYSGTVTALHGAVGDIIATGARLIDLQPGARAGAPAAVDSVAAVDSAAAFDSGTVVGSMPNTSDEELVEPALIGRPRRDDLRTRAVPLARALADRLGLDLAALKGSGADGVVRLDDVLAHASLGALAAPRATAAANGGMA
ncbi:MAG: E3 binding domain-containing protein, partial [Pseudomonadota bacterium]|nr:E3 binding domain-containing protein [Pseudomonadota bacterium]